ncbi:PASTA domain-containing protein [Ornithinibacillus sp. L9]|uniref:serine-type D-Ala-D-Ala carboxypeptidase n=1 Tax=Ornithinibacillus caprae TaxID=2678566 RepID=A0A6N8FLD3_9BACI|nr:penicillin-binding transpeptidase domain-containing protein [Ornithinibacillus caprae]MUK89536.1 PASTA domain-containing protein [Ornithinibacillus caprae]
MKKNKTTHLMTGILLILFVGVFLVLTGRFLYIQAAGEVQNVSLEKWAKEIRTSSYTLDSERGRIFDNNGMTLAYDMPTYRIYAIVDETYSANLEEPKHVEDPEKTAEQLAPFLDVDKQYILDRLNSGVENEKVQIEFGAFGKDISQSERDEIEKLNLPGINFIRESTRHYPNGMFASHIIGFARESEVEIEENTFIKEIQGVTGIEREMNDLLSGKDGYISYERDLYNKKLLDPNEVVKQPENGDDVYLTIDQKIQTLLEDVMSQVDEKYEPERITAIVMNPKTGEILAMGNRPSYNPNNPADVQNWYNDAISTPFEPGSTMKMFTWAAAIEEGVYKGSDMYKSGSYQINDRINPVHDHNNGKGWDVISYDEGFARSSNVAAAKLVWEVMGPDAFLDYIKAFHLDQTTGIDLPGEVGGKILYNWPLEKITTSFGQGSTVTPIQQMKAATAIANDGKMVKPFVIKKIVDTDTNNIIEETKPEVIDEPISKETAEQVRSLLESAVQAEYGTGRRFNLSDYSVAGKTGTAEIPNPDGPGYLAGGGNYIFSFLGMAPAEDPELMMYVSVKQPNLVTEDGVEPGSAPVSFIFNHVMENSLHYLNIEPDKEEFNESHLVEIPKLVGTNVENSKQSLTDLGFRVTVVGSGSKVAASNALQGSSILQNERIILITDQPTMPDITGWSMRDVWKLADLLEVKVETAGHGYVVNQSIQEGKSVSKNDVLEVELNSPTEEEEAPEDESGTESDES